MDFSDLSYAVWQYQLHGYVTNSMIIVNILHAIYVVDFFVNEDWSVFTLSAYWFTFPLTYLLAAGTFAPSIFATTTTDFTLLGVPWSGFRQSTLSRRSILPATLLISRTRLRLLSCPLVSQDMWYSAPSITRKTLLDVPMANARSGERRQRLLGPLTRLRMGRITNRCFSALVGYPRLKFCLWFHKLTIR